MFEGDKNLAVKIDQLVRNGHSSEAREILKKISIKKIRPNLKGEYASLARRVQLFDFALSLLWDRVKGPFSRDASDSEKSEYAAALLRIGSVHEARKILLSVDQLNLATLYLGFCEVVQWNYLDAVIWFQRYLEYDNLSEYQRLIGELNLLACQQFNGEPEKVITAIQNGERILNKQSNRLLQSHFFEIGAQAAITLGEFDLASEFLSRSRQSDLNMTPQRMSILEKWELVLAIERGEIPYSSNLFSTLIRRSARQRDFETIRDCHFHLARFSGKNRDFAKVYFGTPFVSFRKRIESMGWQPDTEYSYSRDFITQSKIINIEELILNAKDTSMVRILISLLRDHFKPQTIGGLFYEMFPEEYYNPFSSPNRVYQSLHRFRKWLLKTELGWNLEQQRGYYSLKPAKEYSTLIISRNLPGATSSTGFLISQLRSSLKKQSINREDLENFLCISSHKASRLLQKGIKEGFLKKQGTSIYTEYLFVDSK